MKKYILTSIIAVTAIVSGSALATTGGPTYISEIAFNPGDNSLYYIVNTHDERGCLPVINKVNLSNLITSELMSCIEIESGSNREGYPQFIQDTYQKLSYLGSVSLEKNKVDVKVKFLSENKEEGMTFWSDFQAAVLQDGKEVGKINFRGCSEDQPHIFEGYMIPDSSSMAILISNKGDCMEGGYVKETIHVVKGIQYFDKTIIRDIKTDTATEPNTGNKVVYAGVVETQTPEVLPVETNSKTSLYLGIATVLGLGLGYIFGRKSRMQA